MNIWDCSGTPRFYGLNVGYAIGIQACMIFVNNNEEALVYKQRLQIEENIPYIIVKSKCDLSGEQMGIIPSTNILGGVKVINTSSRALNREDVLLSFKEIIRLLRGDNVANLVVDIDN